MTRRNVLTILGLLMVAAPTLRLRVAGGARRAEGGQLPGQPASPDVRQAIEATIRVATARLEVRDLNGVLTHVSEEYRTEDVTKPVLREQLVALFSLYEAVRVRLRIDEVRTAGDTAWIWTTGQMFGRVPGVPVWVPTFTWEREPEVARRENGSWRLYGLQ